MKRFEKDIKKNSAKLIESSLPEINELDKISIKPKTNKKLPLILAPMGVAFAAIAVVAIVLPIALRSEIRPITSSSHNSSSYDKNDYKPKLDTFNEVAYYAYFAYKQQDTNTKNNKEYTLRSKDIKAESPGTYVELRERFTDNYGREHRPIPLDLQITFSDFIFFEFDAQDSIFLDERVGNGHINGLVIQNSYLEQDMLILKNGEKYYSCLVYGGAPYRNGNRAYYQFSAHKSIEGFDYVTDDTNMRLVTLYFSGTNEGLREYETLSSIDIEGVEYPIDTNTVVYDESSIVCSIGEVREHFGLDAYLEISNIYGGMDQLVYDASAAQTSSFNLEEFEGTFLANQNSLYLGETKVLDLEGTSKIYASEINKDSHRDLVLDTIIEGEHTYAIYDIYHNRYLAKLAVSQIKKYDYDLQLDMIDNRLVIKWFEPGMTGDDYMLDYGFFAYKYKDGIGINWQNVLNIGQIRLKGVYEADGSTPVECVDNHYYVNTNAQYIIEMEVGGSLDNPYLYARPEHPIRYRNFVGNYKFTSNTIGWEQVSFNDGLYRYQMSFPTSGFSYYQVYFYRYNFDLFTAVDVRLEN